VIVHANFNRLVVCTKKPRIADAVGYIQYVTTNTRAKPLFQLLDMNYVQCWSILLWMNQVGIYSFVLFVFSAGELRRRERKSFVRSTE
jgi:DNA polymerase epsilon subunit 1